MTNPTRPLSSCLAYLSAGVLLLGCSVQVACASDNLVSDPGFELQKTDAVDAPWFVQGQGLIRIDHGHGHQHSGINEALLDAPTGTGWSDIDQWINVTPNTNYTLTGWIQDNFTKQAAYFGVRNADGLTVLQQSAVLSLHSYTKLVVSFNSGPNRTVELFAGFTGNGTDTWLRFDDVSIVRPIVPPPSKFFSTMAEEGYSTYQMTGDGDLWPSCWAPDGNLYAASGDGSGFIPNGPQYDLTVSRISGTPPHLTGTTIATNVGTAYSAGPYNRKPTGMVCVGGAIYLAFQDMDYRMPGDKPTASIAESTDNGNTWKWNVSAPMFGTPNNSASPAPSEFTTIFFADFGQDSANAIDNYVYAYGLDNSWQGEGTVYLARVPNTSIMTRSAWTFFTGKDKKGNPSWSSDIAAKAPVLEDDRLLYQAVLSRLATQSRCHQFAPVIGPGGVVYDARLKRFIFSTSSCATHEFYEAPKPWGPWSFIGEKDFSGTRTPTSRGGYATTIPSKFISGDGKTLMLQSNLCCSGKEPNPGQDDTFSLRYLYMTPYVASSPTNQMSDTANLAEPSNSPVAIAKSTHFGRLCAAGCSDLLNDGNVAVNQSEDDFDFEAKPTDWWGYTWPKNYNMNKVVFEHGKMFLEPTIGSSGGWWSGDLTVQVRQNFEWVNVTGLTISPAYPYSIAAGTNTTYTFRFNKTWGDGVRIIGTPGGISHFTSVSKIGVFYDAGNLVNDPGFEFQIPPGVSAPWHFQGPDSHRIDHGPEHAHTGTSEARVGASTGTNWNDIDQWISVTPNTNYILTGWIQNNFATDVGYFGIRESDGHTVLARTTIGAAANYTKYTVHFNSGAYSAIELFAGFTGQNVGRWMRIDDLSLHQ